MLDLVSEAKCATPIIYKGFSPAANIQKQSCLIDKQPIGNSRVNRVDECAYFSSTDLGPFGAKHILLH